MTDPVPLHDWTRVSAGRWHHMHLLWTGALAAEMNAGLLPDPFFAVAEPAGRRERVGWRAAIEPDVSVEAAVEPPAGCVRFSEAADRFGRMEVLDPQFPPRRIVVRHPDGDRVVAIVEFASPGNRDSVPKVVDFTDKLAAALEAGIHAVLIDLFPGTGPAPDGLHGAVTARFGATHRLDHDRPLTFAGYRAVSAPGVSPTAFVQSSAVGEPPPTVPLFLDPAWCIPLDLAPSYAAAFRGCPKPVRERLAAA